MKVNQALVLALVAFQANAFLDLTTQSTETQVEQTGGSGGGSESTQTGGNGGSGSSSVSTFRKTKTRRERKNLWSSLVPWGQISTKLYPLALCH